MAIPLLFGITIVSFGIMHLAPGGPITLMMDPNIEPADQQRMIHALGLDQPVYIQYFHWIGGVLQGDWGYSYIKREPVMGMILDRLPNTLLLTGVGFILAIIIAIPAGIYSATHQYTKVDYTLTVTSFLGIATPNFWLALMMIMLFSVQLHWLPAGGVSSLDQPFSIGDRIAHLLMPALVLGADSIAGWSRFTRSGMLEVIRQDYIRTARAKGLLESKVIFKHGFRNGLIPLVTIMGLSLPGFFGGAVITETMFSWPGMGRLFIEAVFQRDYPLIMAITMFSAVIVVIGNLIADIAYGLLDPRISYK